MAKTEVKSIEVRPYMPGELAKLYQVSHPTILRWIKGLGDKIGKRDGQYYTTKQVEIIFEELGLPKTIYF